MYIYTLIIKKGVWALCNVVSLKLEAFGIQSILRGEIRLWLFNRKLSTGNFKKRLFIYCIGTCLLGFEIRGGGGGHFGYINYKSIYRFSIQITANIEQWLRYVHSVLFTASTRSSPSMPSSIHCLGYLLITLNIKNQHL